MSEDFRRFSVNDPFGRTWNVDFRWQQNAISIRHADAIDCKYYVSNGGERRELVVSLPHADLLAVALAAGRDLSDAWLSRLAGLHVRHIVSNWEDLDQVVSVVSREEMTAYNRVLEAAAEQAATERR